MTYEEEQQASLYLKDFIIIKFSNIVDALTLLALKGPLTDNIQISGIFNHKILLKCSLLVLEIESKGFKMPLGDPIVMFSELSSS